VPGYRLAGLPAFRQRRQAVQDLVPEGRAPSRHPVPRRFPGVAEPMEPVPASTPWRGAPTAWGRPGTPSRRSAARARPHAAHGPGQRRRGGHPGDPGRPGDAAPPGPGSWAPHRPIAHSQDGNRTADRDRIAQAFARSPGRPLCPAELARVDSTATAVLRELREPSEQACLALHRGDDPAVHQPAGEPREPWALPPHADRPRGVRARGADHGGDLCRVRPAPPALRGGGGGPFRHHFLLELCRDSKVYCAVRKIGDSPSRTAQSGGESDEGRRSAPLGRVRGEG
jgi:hypothetical protein